MQREAKLILEEAQPHPDDEKVTALCGKGVKHARMSDLPKKDPFASSSATESAGQAFGLCMRVCVRFVRGSACV